MVDFMNVIVVFEQLSRQPFCTVTSPRKCRTCCFLT